MHLRSFIAAFLMAVVLLGCNAPAPQVAQAQPMQAVALADGATFDLAAQVVEKTIAGKAVRMYAYNGMIPGPTLRVRQGSTITVNFKNAIDQPATVHWHGIRLLNKNDGVPGVTQAAVQPGETFAYELAFPDDGVYWYHPHVREDMQQELGLYGAIVVEPADAKRYNAVDREEVVFLDDILLNNGVPEPFAPDFTSHALSGRYGNQMLVNGRTDYALSVVAGERVRFLFIDSANVRPFNISIEQMQWTVVGGDSGLYEREFRADAVILAPSERAMVEALFDRPGTYRLMHRAHGQSYVLGTVTVSDGKNAGNAPVLHANPAVEQDVARLKSHLSREPDVSLELLNDQTMGTAQSMMRSEPIEWEDHMPIMNSRSSTKSVRWIMRDAVTGKENQDIHYHFKVGDVKKFRFFDRPESMHAMQHPIHLHGQRFLVVSQDGVLTKNFVWKDTVLVPAGSTVDILVEFTNPGEWMIHCHVAEHLEAGMMSMFTVEP
jgi:FtsP/CotA-like multicopper oxidase with cupredoxin domain